MTWNGKNRNAALTFPIKCDILISRGSTNGFIERQIKSQVVPVAGHLDQNR